MSFKIETVESAPAGSRGILEGYQKKLGFVPNLLGVMAASPAVIEGYVALGTAFDKTSFTPAERQVVLLETSSVNGCTYCMAAHTAIAKMQNIPDAVVNAIRSGETIADPKYEALRAFVRSTVETRGRPDAKTAAAFLGAGYTQTHILEILLGVAMKTMSNYINHAAETPLDAAFSAARWEKAACCK